jgi:dephospho-CoA kinase
MFIIGITGGTGSGKTTALAAIKALGGCVIDCDAVYHELLNTNQDMLSEIEARFNGTVTDGVLDRKKLGQIVFSDAAALNDLNEITHKYVTKEVDKILDAERAAGRRLAAIDAIALIESGRGKLCDLTAAVIAPFEDRVKRLMARDGVSEEYARLRISAQKSDNWYREHCDIILESSDSITQEEFLKHCMERFSAFIK